MRKIAFAIVVLLVSCAEESTLETGGSDTGRSRLSLLLGASESANSPMVGAAVLPGRKFTFPRDHRAHPAFRNEWWYFTGHLRSASGRAFGYELTLFRFRLTDAGAPKEQGAGWQDGQLLVGHFALSDIRPSRFVHTERVARRGAAVAGFDPDRARVFIDDWSIQFDEQNSSWKLLASLDTTKLSLTLTATAPPILNGERGYSQKSANPANASYYYSQPLLATAGALTLDDETLSVTGTTWLDREWSSSALEADQLGWDWFAITFADDSTLMLYQIRTAIGDIDPYSSGTYRSATGEIHHLTSKDFSIDVLDYWRSPRGSKYPSRWQLRVPSLELAIAVTPLMSNQELTGIVNYWEGAVEVLGTREERPLSGAGYVELTGY